MLFTASAKLLLALMASSLISAVSGTYLVQLAPGADIEQYLDSHPTLRQKLLRTYSFGKFRAVLADCDDTFVKSLEYNPLVQDISPDIELRANSITTQTGAPRHLARVSQTGPLSSTSNLTYSYDSTAGTGVDAYVLDTGIYKEHPDFGGRAVVGSDFTGEGAGDENGHGTHVAGLIGSATYGVAKNISLIEVKVLNQQGGGSVRYCELILAGLDYAVNQRTATGRKSVANLSLGAMYNTMLNNAITSAVESGLAVVVAAGNDGFPACAFSPASAREALTVGAFDDAGDSIASFSNWGHCVDVFAPGVAIQSLLNSGSGTVVYSGTSMASPIAAGLVGYYMGLGDDEAEAVERVKSTATWGALPWCQVLLRPFTPKTRSRTTWTERRRRWSVYDIGFGDGA
ncbi:peptidase S8/S53 domain-containing protein [Myxozyma melibiosi]|uniref:Peptidase S8/S53 domain-containing protein n=1 Tax=Myxozyma melibiosi TaxID=54550 RepID=A0ABR1F4P1_9ASCO